MERRTRGGRVDTGEPFFARGVTGASVTRCAEASTAPSYDPTMSPRDPRLQAAALRLVAERVECGEALAPELAEALANDMAKHPEDVAAIEAHEGSLPQWMAEELDRREREDAGSEEDGDVVMARLLAKHPQRRRSA
jgi:hypothetical protein